MDTPKRNRFSECMAVVLPCYNEESRIQPDLFFQFAKENPNIQMLFVNDGSTDGTQQSLEELCGRSNRIDVLRLSQNAGKAEAIRQGFCHVYENSSCEIIGFIDADLAIPLEQLLRLRKVFNNKSFKVALTSPYLHPEEMIHNKESHLFRYFGSRLFRLYVRSFFNLKVSDSQCGCKLFHRDLVPVMLEKPFLARWLFDVELLLCLKEANLLAVKEVQLQKLNSNRESKMQ